MLRLCSAADQQPAISIRHSALGTRHSALGTRHSALGYQRLIAESIYPNRIRTPKISQSPHPFSWTLHSSQSIIVVGSSLALKGCDKKQLNRYQNERELPLGLNDMPPTEVTASVPCGLQPDLRCKQSFNFLCRGAHLFRIEKGSFYFVEVLQARASFILRLLLLTAEFVPVICVVKLHPPEMRSINSSAPNACNS